MKGWGHSGHTEDTVKSQTMSPFSPYGVRVCWVGDIVDRVFLYETPIGKLNYSSTKNPLFIHSTHPTVSPVSHHPQAQ